MFFVRECVNSLACQTKGNLSILVSFAKDTKILPRSVKKHIHTMLYSHGHMTQWLRPRATNNNISSLIPGRDSNNTTNTRNVQVYYHARIKTVIPHL